MQRALRRESKQMAIADSVTAPMQSRKRVLIVDDEPSICRALCQLFEADGFDVAIAANVADAKGEFSRQQPDVLVIDVRLPDGDGIAALQELRREYGTDVPAIVMTAYGDLETATRAVHAGAMEYLPKPFSLEDVSRAVARALKRGGEEASNEVRRTVPDVPLLGESVAMQRLFKQIALAASSDLPVLITGESGTGKELVAQAIHRYSGRSGPLVAVCLPALNPALIESELFGHVRGAFTGAVSDKAGYFEHAGGGTLFLDEISEIPTGLQAKLLRVLESRTFCRVGSIRPQPMQARVVAATNRRLNRLIKKGGFRLDLYYRLSAIHLHVPPLRKRRSDIPLLAEYFLGEYAARTGATLRFDESTLRELRRRDWPGNVRQLRFAVEYAAVRAREGVVLPEHLPAPEDRPPTGRSLNRSVLKRCLYRWGKELAEQILEQHGEDAQGALYNLFQDEAGRSFLKGVLDACSGNLSLAARLLGMHRATLRNRLRS